ncbi:MAG: transposase [Rhodobacteraceae bacterium]|nr:transposase [Paracoccaceae bacterium]
MVLPNSRLGPVLKDEQKVKDGIFCVLRTDCNGVTFPNDMVPNTTCYHRDYHWSKDGTWQTTMTAGQMVGLPQARVTTMVLAAVWQTR